MNSYRDEDRFLTLSQAADILNISLSTMKKLVYQDKIKTFKTPGGHHRILKRDLFAGLQPQEEAVSSISKEDLMDYLYAFAGIMESRYRFGHGHALAVSKISKEIAKELGFSETNIEKIIRASLLHDIGLMVISEDIVNAQTLLTRKAYETIKSHPQAGAQILNRFPIFSDIVPIVEQHHERPDGSGYPYGLKGDEICIEARIIGLAEAFDCMTSANSYQKSLKREEAIEYVRQGSGSQFDPAVVNAFLRGAKNIRIETKE
ncbi:MAG: HD domain-containing protein [Candidatus Omnitrophica bacterium]|nr:HD domain-containing protein [Candidatus Omnitrophota bacterium]